MESRANRSVSRWIALGIIAMVLGSGCYGKSVLSSGVSKWHSNLQMDKYSKEAIFVPVFILVMPFTAMVDYFILNSIDYWTTEGDPLLTTEAERTTPAAGGGLAAAPYRMVVEKDRSVLEDSSGNAVAELRRQEDGSLVLTDLRSGEERRIAQEEVAVIRGR